MADAMSDERLAELRATARRGWSARNPEDQLMDRHRDIDDLVREVDRLRAEIERSRPVMARYRMLSDAVGDAAAFSVDMGRTVSITQERWDAVIGALEGDDV